MPPWQCCLEARTSGARSDSTIPSIHRHFWLGAAPRTPRSLGTHSDLQFVYETSPISLSLTWQAELFLFIFRTHNFTCNVPIDAQAGMFINSLDLLARRLLVYGSWFAFYEIEIEDTLTNGSKKAKSRVERE